MEYFIDFIIQPVYLWAFQTNREQFRLLFPYRSTKIQNIPQPIYDIILSKNQRMDLIMKSNLSVILAKKLVANIQNPRKHALRISLQKHYFEKKEVKCIGCLDKSCFAFHPFANPPIIATGTKIPELWQILPNNVETNTLKSICISDFEGEEHNDIITSISFHSLANPSILGIGYRDGMIKLWRISNDYSTMICIAKLEGHTKSVTNIAFHTSEPILASSSCDRTIKIWCPMLLSLNNSILNCLMTINSSCGDAINFHPFANPPILGILNQNEVELWKINVNEITSECIYIFNNSFFFDFTFHPKKNIIAFGTNNYTAEIWRLSDDFCSANLINTLSGEQKGWVFKVAFHPTLNFMATYCFGIHLWHFNDDYTSAKQIKYFSENYEELFGYDKIDTYYMYFHPKMPILAASSLWTDKLIILRT